MATQRVLFGALIVVLGVMICREVAAEGMCGLRPPASETHPSDLNADGETTPEEFQQYAKVSTILNSEEESGFKSGPFGPSNRLL
jgi:hypothetical protein